jgi:amidase
MSKFARQALAATILGFTMVVGGALHAQETVATYLARIKAIDKGGPKLNAVIAINPDAAKAEAAARKVEGPLAGKVILVKDNIETADPMPTTAGSLALKDNRTGRDAPFITGLRSAGVVVLGKTNLSEWANMRSSASSSGWSGVGGQTRNSHALDRTPCGSSSGSGAAVAAGLAWAAIGSETDGSIICPASMNGIVGFKPTVGMISRTHVVPISHSQDTVGPMTTSVRDAALMLSAMAGSDPADAATAGADAHKTDFAAGLAVASLKGVRLGVLRKAAGTNPKVVALFEGALADLKAAGATLVEISYEVPAEMGRDEYTVLLYELRTDLAAYLQSLPASSFKATPPIRTLADAIAFNKAHPEELKWFGQDIFEEAEVMTDTAVYKKARENSLRLAGRDGIDKLLAENRVSFLIAPSAAPAWPIDLVTGDHGIDVGMGSMAAIAGYPHLTVPMGAVEDLPLGLSFMGAQWDDKRVLEAGAAYERARTAKVPRPSLRRLLE